MQPSAEKGHKNPWTKSFIGLKISKAHPPSLSFFGMMLKSGGFSFSGDLFRLQFSSQARQLRSNINGKFKSLQNCFASLETLLGKSSGVPLDPKGSRKIGRNVRFGRDNECGAICDALLIGLMSINPYMEFS